MNHTGQVELCYIPHALSIDERFERFHKANPHVYDELVAVCRRAVQAGYIRIGVKMAWEVMRWNIMLRTRTEDDFKLNNDFHSRYARLVMEREPDLAGIFEVRELKSQRSENGI